MKHIISLAGFFFTLLTLYSQNTEPLTGIVTNEKEELLIGASVYWADTKVGTVTDTAGRFSLAPRDKEATLVVSYVGYTPAQVQVLPEEKSIWLARGAAGECCE